MDGKLLYRIVTKFGRTAEKNTKIRWFDSICELIRKFGFDSVPIHWSLHELSHYSFSPPLFCPGPLEQSSPIGCPTNSLTRPAVICSDSL